MKRQLLVRTSNFPKFEFLKVLLFGRYRFNRLIPFQMCNPDQPEKKITLFYSCVIRPLFVWEKKIGSLLFERTMAKISHKMQVLLFFYCTQLFFPVKWNKDTGCNFWELLSCFWTNMIIYWKEENLLAE